MTARSGVAVIVGVLALACCGGRQGGETENGESSEGPCGLSGSTRFSADPKLSEALKLQRENGGAETLSGAELESACTSSWNDDVEAAHCGRVIAAFCQTPQCATDAEAVECAKDTRRELVMQRCREEALPTFQTEFPPCKDFKLCKNQLRSSC